jgi:hypothetical protein
MLWKRVLEALDRNTAWRVFRHVKTAGDVLVFFGGWLWLATGAGAVISYFAGIPWYGKLSLAFCSVVVILAGVLVWKLLRATPESIVGPLPQSKSNKARGIAKTIGMVGVIVLAIVISSNKFNPPSSLATTSVPVEKYPVYPPFQDLYNRSRGLGEPRRIIPRGTGLYEAGHEKAFIIWSNKYRKIFVLFSGSGTGREFEETRSARKQFTTDDGTRKYFARKRLLLPPGTKPPFSGVAEQWILDPNYWLTKIGGRIWHCSPMGAVIQEFSNGWIIGGLVSADYDIHNKQAFSIILKGSKDIEFQVEGLPWEASTDDCLIPPGTSN